MYQSNRNIYIPCHILIIFTCKQYLRQRGFVMVIGLNPGQTIATCQHNISQHCWVQHVACIWPPCCDMLGVVGPNFTIFKLEPTTPGQHVTTHCSMVAKHTQHAAPNNVAICCAVMLQSFRRGLIVAQKVVHFNMGGVRKFDQLKVHMSNVHRVRGNVEFVHRQIH